MKSFASSLVLLLVVGGFGFYLWRNERGPIADAGSTVLLRSDPATVRLVKIAGPGGSKVITLRQAKGWEVSQDSGIEVPADAEVVDGFLKEVQLIQSPTVIAYETGKAKEYGLDKPAATLTIDSTVLQLGGKTALDPSQQYVRIGDKIAVLPGEFETAAKRSFADWRDKTILHAKPEDTTRLEVKTPAFAATFVKQEKAAEDDADTWKIEGTVTADADNSVVEAFLTELSANKSATPPAPNPYQPPPPAPPTLVYIDDNPKSPAQWGLDKPLITIRATTSKGLQTLTIGKKLTGGYAGQNSGSKSVFLVPEMVFGLANRPLRDWRSKSIVKFELTDLNRLEMRMAGRNMTFNKVNDKWQLMNGSGQPGNFKPGEAEALNQDVLDMLLALRSPRADDFVDKPASPSAYGFDTPLLTVKVIGTKEGERSMMIGRKAGKGYIQTASSGRFTPPVYAVSATSVDAIAKAAAKLSAGTSPKAK